MADGAPLGSERSLVLASERSTASGHTARALTPGDGEVSSTADQPTAGASVTSTSDPWHR